MNYLDELLALYPGRDWHTQRYFLTQVSGLAPGLETDALLEFLWGQTAAARPELRHMARRQLGRALPGCLRQAYGLEEGKLGIWTAYAAGPARGAKDAVVDTATHQRLLAAGFHRLSPLLGRALALLPGGSPRVRLAASLVAGRIQTRSGMGALNRGVLGHDKVSFWHAAAMADLGAPEVQPRLLEVAAKLGRRAPDLAMLLADVPAKQGTDALDQLERGADTPAATAIAMALGSEAGSDARHVIERLIKRNEGWVTAYALDALAACPESGDLAIAQRVYDREPREFLRVQAVKIAGALPGNDAVGFLLQVLKSGSARVQAAALESLARKRVDAARLAADAALHLASPLLKLRVNAMLVLARRDPEQVLESLDALLSSGETVHRVEGAYVLGYLRHPSAAQILGDLALTDPRTPVRLQAIKSLAKQEPGEAIGKLLAAARGTHARTAGLAVRALAALPEDALAQARGALEEAAAAAGSAATRGLALRALGIAACRAHAVAPPALVKALGDKQELVVLGALEGLKCVGGAPLPALSRLAASPDPRVSHRAMVAAFLQGDLAVLEPLDQLLVSEDEPRVLAGLQALLELGVLLPIALAAPQFCPLRDALERVAGETAVRTFAIEEQPRAPQLAELAPRQRSAGSARFDAVPLNVPVRRSVPRPPSTTARKAGLDAPLERGSVEGTTYLDGLPAVPALAEFVRTYRALLAAAAVLLIPLVMTLARWQTNQNAGPAAPLPSGALKCRDAKGLVEHGVAGKGTAPLLVRGQLLPGQTVSTGPGAQALLADGAGNVLALSESSSATLATPPKGGTCPYLIEEPSGDLLVDFRKSKGVEVELGADRLVLDLATARVVRQGGTTSVALIAGSGRLVGPQARALEQGAAVELRR